MNLYQFLARSLIYIACFMVSWFGMSAVDYEKILKKGHVREAQVLYFLIVIALAYLCAQFILGFIYLL